jgi:ABC-type multidrug transport system ATPase subunit
MKQQGTTILLVEQNVERALSISDRAYILDQGRIVHEAHAADLLADEDIQSRYCANLAVPKESRVANSSEGVPEGFAAGQSQSRDQFRA